MCVQESILSLRFSSLENMWKFSKHPTVLRISLIFLMTFFFYIILILAPSFILFYFLWVSLEAFQLFLSNNTFLFDFFSVSLINLCHGFYCFLMSFTFACSCIVELTVFCWGYLFWPFWVYHVSPHSYKLPFEKSWSWIPKGLIT